MALSIRPRSILMGACRFALRLVGIPQSRRNGDHRSDAREPERRTVSGDATISVEGATYRVGPELAGETVTLLWVVPDRQLFVEHDGKRYGPCIADPRTPVIDVACAGGPVFCSGYNDHGDRIPFADAYPEAPAWIRRFAGWIER